MLSYLSIILFSETLLVHVLTEIWSRVLTLYAKMALPESLFKGIQSLILLMTHFKVCEVTQAEAFTYFSMQNFDHLSVVNEAFW